MGPLFALLVWGLVVAALIYDLNSGRIDAWRWRRRRKRQGLPI